MLKEIRQALTGLSLAIAFGLSAPAMAGGEHGVEMAPYRGELCDTASLQRGAAIYMNYCSGCHSLQYMRYKGMGEGIGIRDLKTGEVLEALIQDKLNFVSQGVQDPIKTAMPTADAEGWFGVAPPDLTLVARVRGTEWLYNYLTGFYEDPSRPWGVNNRVFPDVGMPHVLEVLQGKQTPVFRKVNYVIDGQNLEKDELDHLELTQPGLLSPAEYDQAVTDLVNFLDYAGEPMKLQRQSLGVWVLLFLGVFLVFALLLKREFWKDVH